MSRPSLPLWDITRIEAAYEAAVEATQGEITPDVEAIEAVLGATVDGALEQLGCYLLHLAHVDDAIAAEKRRLADRAAATGQARAWAKKEIVRLLGDRKSADVGTVRIQTRKGSTSVFLPDNLDHDALAAVIPGAVRTKVTRSPDKARLREELDMGTPEERAPLEALGIRLVMGERSVTVK